MGLLGIITRGYNITYKSCTYCKHFFQLYWKMSQLLTYLTSLERLLVSSFITLGIITAALFLGGQQSHFLMRSLGGNLLYS